MSRLKSPHPSAAPRGDREPSQLNDPAPSRPARRMRILMLLENESCPDDTRVAQEARTLQQ
ncbi:MAG: hypothetical protein KF861_08805, partial [Planctomycetaceae bacterium]|nr:hypothetical protein [Planctomycetaceae bacterium]